MNGVSNLHNENYEIRISYFPWAKHHQSVETLTFSAFGVKSRQQQQKGDYFRTSPCESFDFSVSIYFIFCLSLLCCQLWLINICLGSNLYLGS